jgi:hypothetical protein
MLTRRSAPSSIGINGSIRHRARHLAPWLPIAGICAFVVLYFCAATVFPGGSESAHLARGYSHRANYWCDLLRHVSASGEANPGRSLAVVATLILPLSLIPFWIQISVLFRRSLWSKRVVQAAGSTSMVLSILIVTPHHDFVVNVSAILGFVAVVVAMVNLARSKQGLLIGIACAAMILGVTNYLMWQTGSLLWLMPMVQKAAFVAFFVWIIATSLAIRRGVAGRGDSQADG